MKLFRFRSPQASRILTAVTLGALSLAAGQPSSNGDAKTGGPDSSTGIDGKERYEEAKIATLAEVSRQIADLRTRVNALQGREREAAMAPLRTAAGNRLVAMTKLQHLMAAPPEAWLRLKPGVDSAFTDLQSAVARTQASLAH